MTDISPASGGADGAPDRAGASGPSCPCPGPGLSDQEATEAYLNSLPELRAGERFRFACHPGVSCFNACCHDVNLVLSPYDVLRLRRHLRLPSRDFLRRHTESDVLPGAGFPLRRLRMRDDRTQACPFVRDAGCSVYDDRPAACRTYPLGRTAQRRAGGGIEAHLYVVREPHCTGFEDAQAVDWSGASWLGDQELEPYNACSDRYSDLVGRWCERGRSLGDRSRTMVELALYRLDDFQTFLSEVPLLERLELDTERRRSILENEARCLEFAFEWLEMLLLDTGATPD